MFQCQGKLELLSDTGARAGSCCSQDSWERLHTGMALHQEPGSRGTQKLEGEFVSYAYSREPDLLLGLSFMLDLYPENAGKCMQRAGSGIRDVARAAEPGCSTAKGVAGVSIP